jgi:hypothetical protein
LRRENNSLHEYHRLLLLSDVEGYRVRIDNRTNGRESENRKGLKLFQDLSGQHIANTFILNPLFPP